MRRKFQVTLFVLAVISFITAAICTGSLAGDALWRAGVALLLGDLVCLRLWPSSPAGKSASQSRDHQQPRQ